MAMYFMDGETFLKQYIKEDPRKVLRTQFVIVSSTIRKCGRYDNKNVINANNMLMPGDQLIIDYDDYKHDKNYRDAYFESLDEHKAFLSTLIKYAIEENYTIVFLCGKREKKYNYLKLLQKYVDEIFEYHIYDYKKYKDGKESVREFNPSYVLHICDKEIKKTAKRRKENMLKNKDGRKKLFSSMSKKELKKELKKRDLYVPDLTKNEMIDMLDTFM